MKITMKYEAISEVTANNTCLVVGVFADLKLSYAEGVLNSTELDLIKSWVENGDVSGDSGSRLMLRYADNSRILLLGLGENKNFYGKSIVKSILAELKGTKISSLTIAFSDEQLNDSCAVIVNDFEYANYKYSQTLSKQPKVNSLENISFISSNSATTEVINSTIAKHSAIGKGVNLARSLGDCPPNICTPTYLADQAQNIAESSPKITATILNESEMFDLKMGSLLSVSAGSKQEAKLIVLEYKGAKDTQQQPYALVGKGVTFDSGGISLKPGLRMDEMKYDMCGAASVMGVFTALAELQPDMNVVGIIPATENMPNGVATKPGDVVTSMSGQTIEILNTDAEGRLILCDALTYVAKYNPIQVVDIATLTGAVIVALGKKISGLMSNDDKLAAELEVAGTESKDQVWRLPMNDDYDEQLQSNFADIANIGGREAGTITAACFLGRFTKDYKWAHLDIAGTAWIEGKDKGATGRPVRLLMQYLLNKQ